MNDFGIGSASMPATRPLYGFESAAERIAEQTKRLHEQVVRLETLLAPATDNASALGQNNKAEPRPGYASELLQCINGRADALSDVSDRLESLIQRIRL